MGLYEKHKKAIVTNRERLLYGEKVDIIAKIELYVDQDGERYFEEELKFIK